MLPLLRRRGSLMKQSLPQLALALGTILILVTLMVLMVKRKLRTVYPLFYAFLIINLLSAVILIPAYRYAIGQYFYVYWTCSTVIMLVGFAVLYEVFVNILKPFSAVINNRLAPDLQLSEFVCIDKDAAHLVGK